MANSKTGLAALIDTIMIRCRRILTTPINSTRTMTHSDVGHNLVDASAGNIVITLPLSNSANGAVDTLFRRTDATSNTVTILCQGSDKLVLDDPAGVTSVLLTGQGAVLEIRADAAAKWYSLAMSASQTVVNAGVDDTQAVTPKKLKLGFQVSLTAPNGYLVFPTWLGGLTIQWGKHAGATSGNNTVTFPTAFQNACLFTMATIDAEQTSTGDTSRQPLTNGKTTTTATFYVGQTETNGAAAGPFNWFAIGY
jgi:hypothetical protein